MADTMELPQSDSLTHERQLQKADNTEELSSSQGKLGTNQSASTTKEVDIAESHHAATQEATPTSDIGTRDAYVCDEVTTSDRNLHDDAAKSSTVQTDDSKQQEQADTVSHDHAVPAADLPAEGAAAATAPSNSSATATSADAAANSSANANGSTSDSPYKSDDSDIEEPDESRPVSKTNHYGIFMSSDRAGLVLQVFHIHNFTPFSYHFCNLRM
jgi:hypothetical protein